MQTIQIITNLHKYCDLHFDQQHNLLRPLFVHFTMTQKIKRIINLLSPQLIPFGSMWTDCFLYVYIIEVVIFLRDNISAYGKRP